MTNVLHLTSSPAPDTLSSRAATKRGAMPLDAQAPGAFSLALEAARHSPSREEPASLTAESTNPESSEADTRRAGITPTAVEASPQPKDTQQAVHIRLPAAAVPGEQPLEPEAAEPSPASERATADAKTGRAATETTEIPVAGPKSEIEKLPLNPRPQPSPEQGPELGLSADQMDKEQMDRGQMDTVQTDTVQTHAGQPSLSKPSSDQPLTGLRVTSETDTSPSDASPVAPEQTSRSTSPDSAAVQNTSAGTIRADTASVDETIGVDKNAKGSEVHAQSGARGDQTQVSESMTGRREAPPLPQLVLEHSGTPQSRGLAALEPQQTQIAPASATAPATTHGAAAQPLPLSGPPLGSLPASSGATPNVPQPSAAPTLHAQLSGPVAQLVSGANGEKYLTVNVAPENLGPVTVRANISNDTMRIELFAPQDAGREALRGVLHDLRRDLAGLGLGAGQVSLGEGEAPSSSPGQVRGEGAFGERPRDPSAAQTRGEDAAIPDREAEKRGDQSAEHQRDRYGFAITGPLGDETVSHALALRSVGLDLLA